MSLYLLVKCLQMICGLFDHQISHQATSCHGITQSPQMSVTFATHTRRCEDCGDKCAALDAYWSISFSIVLS
jgi:hypothetical protein